MTKVIFVGGASRSGSTLLDRMLGSEVGYASLGEVHHVWQRGMLENHFCGCGLRFLLCPTWSEIRRRIGALSDPQQFATRTLRTQREVVRTRRIPQMRDRPNRTSAEREYAETLESLYFAASQVLEADVIVDSSKRPAHGYFLSTIRDVDLSVFHLIRDSRATAFSTAKAKPKGDGAAPNEMMKTYTPTKSARTWIQSNSLTGLLTRRTKDSTRARYEDLATSPREVLDRTMNDIGLRVSGQWLDGSDANFGEAHTISGNPMRLQTGTVRIALDSAWQIERSSRDMRLVTALTAPWLLAYGYDL